MDSIETKKLYSVEVQANGIIRNSKGRLIGRLVDSVEYEGEHIKGLNEDTNIISDGYHTFGELYEQRARLFIALCKTRTDYIVDSGKYADVWCSVLHSDGTKYDDWFILGIGKEKGKQITYHLPARFWNEVCEFAQVLEKAPEFDGHTSNDVLERISIL